MRRSRQLITSVLAIMLILVACGQSTGSIQLGEQDAGRTIELRRGDRLQVILAGNPTTGYQWQQVAGDSAILTSAGGPTFEPNSSALGSGGMVTVPFQASAAGKTHLILVYHRSFEPNQPPLKTFAIDVVVR
jgi:inhibitor of cysteine peptidase